jgi:hypothetical protein
MGEHKSPTPYKNNWIRNKTRNRTPTLDISFGYNTCLEHNLLSTPA